MIIRTGEAAGGPKALLEDVPRKRLINILNYANYKGDRVIVNLMCVCDGSTLSLKATPEPCGGDIAILTWSEAPPENIDVAYRLVDFFIDKGSRVVVVDGRLMDIGSSGITVLLPQRCYATSKRRMERHSSALIHVTLSRNGSKAVGLLRDFGGGFLKVRVAVDDLGFLRKPRSKQPLQVALICGDTTVYTGKGLVKRRMKNGENTDLVLELAGSGKNEVMSELDVVFDQALVAMCRHPLSGKILRLDLVKASYNSFVVIEHPEHVTFFPGLIVPEMRIDFGTGDLAKCTAKVVGGEAGTWLMSILDMPILDQRKLFSFLEKEIGVMSTVCVKIDPDDLLEFFFEAGFIYPQKYALVANSRERLRDVFSHLYVDVPAIAQHFVQHSKGVIEAHISMVRFYERTWIVQHHAALRRNGAGSTVLAQLFRYINSYSPLPSTRMEYLVAYFRPENRFPNRVFGGFARSFANPRLCSVDPFAYFHYRFDGRKKPDNGPWRLDRATADNLRDLQEFYGRVSGGLTLDAFDLKGGDIGAGDLTSLFEEVGLKRGKQLFSLNNDGKTTAVVMALDSVTGLNMSNLTKCLHVFVIDKTVVPFEVLSSQLSRLSYLYDEQEIPVLLFPCSYAISQGISPEKIYDLLIFHRSVGKRFAEYTERLTNRTTRRKFDRPIAKGTETGLQRNKARK